MNESERVCCIDHTVLEDFLKPYFYFEEIDIENELKQSTGRKCFSAITFSAKIDPFKHIGYFDKLTLIANQTETWNLYKAKVALLPTKEKESDPPSHFVAVFDRCERISTANKIN